MERAEIDIRQILLSIQRQSPLALGVAFIFIAIAATHLFLTKPLYTATALVLFDPSDKNLLDPTSSSDAGGEASARIDSEVEFIRSDAVLLETIRRTPIGAMLADTPAPAGLAQRALATLGLVSHTKPSTAEALHSALTKMRRSTTVKRRGETFIIAITAHSASPERAATVANSLAETYIAAQLRHKISNLENHRAILARHIEDAKIDIANAAAERDRSFEMSQPLPAHQANQAAFHRPIFRPDIVESQNELLRNADVATAQYHSLLERLRDLTAQTDLQVADSQIISAAIVPLYPSSPNYGLTLTLSAIAGLMAGIALALLYEHLIGGFMTDEQMASALKLDEASVLPRARSRTDADSVAELIVDDPSSAYSEAVRRLRASIGFAVSPSKSVTDGGLVIMVCSTTIGEGKTTLAVALARCFARSGASTLLIDGDLRDPGVHRNLKIGPSLALVDHLVRPITDTNFDTLVTTDPLSPLRVVVGAEREDISPTDLLGGRGFEHLITKARSHFDIVIIDTAAMGELADTLYVTPLVQVALLVSHWASTPQHTVKKTLRALRSAGNLSLLVIPVLAQQKERRPKPKLHFHRYGSEI
ncbi:Wzz/FepE/Etk N-terminal domain-containing protein [Devosia sp. MC521]|uniref:GumC family protein n=1 Tax=Devosia sp. MC521 TaxID=2759954 RepID=UPI0015FE5C97|nr:Wzz/FepE/Etk N-terminal domain-containing protein [Devosia sp. MC521]MBJ6986097.1 hypothetical protein [Devosia sp. MC521]QMW61466.1 hypothetical protein H4N61_10790 [Devosia sp. MC521]